MAKPFCFLALVLLFFFLALGEAAKAQTEPCTDLIGLGQKCDTIACVQQCLQRYPVDGQGYCTTVILPNNTHAPTCSCDHFCGPGGAN